MVREALRALSLHRSRLLYTNVVPEDPKLMLGAGFGTPTVRQLELQELRATVTAKAVWLLPDVSRLARDLPERRTSGLIEFYRLLLKSPHA